MLAWAKFLRRGKDLKKVNYIVPNCKHERGEQGRKFESSNFLYKRRVIVSFGGGNSKKTEMEESIFKNLSERVWGFFSFRFWQKKKPTNLSRRKTRASSEFKLDIH